LVRVEAAVSGGEALRDDPNNGCGGD